MDGGSQSCLSGQQYRREVRVGAAADHGCLYLRDREKYRDFNLGFFFLLFTVPKLISVTSQKQVVLVTEKGEVVRAGREEGM